MHPGHKKIARMKSLLRFKKIYYVRTLGVETNTIQRPLLNINSQSQMSFQTKFLRALASTWQNNRVTKWNNSTSNDNCGFATSKLLSDPSVNRWTSYTLMSGRIDLIVSPLAVQTSPPYYYYFPSGRFCLFTLHAFASFSLLLGETLGDYFKWSQRLSLVGRDRRSSREGKKDAQLIGIALSRRCTVASFGVPGTLWSLRSPLSLVSQSSHFTILSSSFGNRESMGD